MKYKIMDGNEACAYISYMFTEIAGIYPITPATPMAEKIEALSLEGKKNILNDKVKLVEMQSEKGAIALVHGALQTGSLASTYTSSQGLLLMLPSMYKIAGEMLPCVINVATRTVATHALSIFSDHSDVYAVRSSGFAFLASTSVQDTLFMTLISYLSTIKSSIPFVNFFDGFRTSHELNKIKVIDENDIRNLVDFKEINDFKKRSMFIDKKIKGTNQNDDIYFQSLEARNKNYEVVPDIVESYMEKINKEFDLNYHPFNYYGKKNATKVIVAMGSVCDVVKELINETNEKFGLIEVHLYRPFSEKYFLKVFPETVEKVAVLDRTKEAGSVGEPLYLDVQNILSKHNKDILVVGGRYGISSKDVQIEDIYAVYRNLDIKNPISSFTIGIEDDVTKKSLKRRVLNAKENKNNIEMLIYGYGSDGMVSASKNLLEIVGNNTKGFVQGYFKYDSKKSGGLTISNLRIGKEPINMPYYVTNPHIVVCTNDFYLKKYDVLKNIRKNGIFILVTNKDTSILPNKVKYELSQKNIRFYTIDAYKISIENNIPNKISTIVEAAIIYITKVLPYEFAKEEICASIKNKFTKKGEEIVYNNIKALESVKENVKEIKIKDSWKDIIVKETELVSIYDYINSENGYKLKVSDLLLNKDGSFKPFQSKNDINALSKKLPNWKSDVCIQCNKCAIVCPHGVITPKILNKKELKENKNIMYSELMGKDNMYFALEINYDKCTGCGACESVCIGKRGLKAIEISSTSNELLNKKIKASFKQIFDENTIKGIGFNESLFRFSSACKGCGETSYLKLLTQIFKDSLVIANATGCSSIYGGDINSPYNISWSNSLFEDNAEYGYGMVLTLKLMQEKVQRVMEDNFDRVKSKNRVLFTKWLENKNNYDVTREVKENIIYDEIPELNSLKPYIESKSVWIVGGDGWSYDIDFDGIDHIMASKENVNILVLDTEVYSNTGGQNSKATSKGAVVKFQENGKTKEKKDLARMMMSYDDVYIARISLGANIMQSIKALKEAQKFEGPSLIIAYAPCITHGIKNGNSLEEEKLAVQSGYFPIYRYNNKELTLDFQEPNFDLLNKFFEGENRFRMLKNINEEKYNKLLEENKNDAIKRFNLYKDMSKKS